MKLLKSDQRMKSDGVLSWLLNRYGIQFGVLGVIHSACAGGDELKISQANRGRSFEQLIEHSNNQYLAKGKALVQKVPTPWRVVRRGKQIISAHPEEKSTVDFVGVSDGNPIAFDAKSTRELTRFPLSNIETHQMVFLQNFHDQGGRAFVLIEFAKIYEVYLVPFVKLREYWNVARKGGRKSIPYEDMKLFPQIRSGNGIALDYLSVFDESLPNYDYNKRLWF